MNHQLFHVINDLGKDSAVLSNVFIFFAEYAVYLLALSMLAFWFTGKKEYRRMVLVGGFTFIAAEILGKIAGLLHHNYQPFAVLEGVNQLIEKSVNNSFPSDHTIVFFSICVSYALAFYRLQRPLISGAWLLLAGIVGISRIGVGVHYPLDVFVAATIATLVAVGMDKVLLKNRLIQFVWGLYEQLERQLLSKK